MNVAKKVQHFRTTDGLKLTSIYIPHNYNSMNLLCEFFCDLETPIINPIYGIERAQIVSYIPRDGWLIFFNRNLVTAAQIDDLIFYINEN